MGSTDLHNVQKKQTTYKLLSQRHASEQQISSGFFCPSHSRHWRNTKGTQTSYLPPGDTTDFMHTQRTFTRSVLSFTNNLEIRLNKYINVSWKQLSSNFQTMITNQMWVEAVAFNVKNVNCMTEEEELIL